MKKYVLQLLILLAFSSPAFANSFGIHLTYPVTVGLQYTLDDTFGENTALRFWGNVAFADSAFAALVQVDGIIAKYGFDPEGLLTGYYGVGGHFSYGTSSGSSVTASLYLFGLQATAGVAYRFTQSVDVFLEASYGYSFGFIYGSSSSMSLTIPFAGSFNRIGGGLNFRL
jgi:hypothetical protein